MSETKEKTIYDLKLHETLTIFSDCSEYTDCLKVHNGWIYYRNISTYPEGKIITATFVPNI